MRRLLAILAIIAVLVGHGASADDLQSPNFLVRDPSFNTFGGIGTSSSFESVHGESQVEGNQATSDSFILDMGPMNFDTYAFATRSWRWYADEENVTPQTALGAENAAPIDIEDQDEIKLRITVAETGGFGADGAKFRLQFSTSSDFSSGAFDVAEQGNCSGATWCYADGGGADNSSIASSTLSDADSCVSASGPGCGTHNEFGTSTSSHTHQAGAAAEYEFTIKQSGAAINTAYFFRLFDTLSSTTVPFDDGEAHPSVVSGGASLTFTIDGIPSGTDTEGVTTDITTSSTDISFGLLPSGSAVTGAQRLSVTTNGTAGYRVYLYERQGLVSETSGEIAPVTGTNATPSNWTTGCSEVALGCFGYHSGDDVLSDLEGDDTRFAPSDTYAQATSTPHEIAFHQGAVADQTTDVVYRIAARNGQENGTYSTSIVYIATPIF